MPGGCNAPPIQKLKQAMDALKPGEKIKILATNPGFARDARSRAKMTSNLLLSLDTQGPDYEAVLEKGGPIPANVPSVSDGRDVTLILFSQDLDRALTALVIANGAASSGKKVTLFFTFWGLSLLKKRRKGRVKKDFTGRMFGMMLPKHMGHFKLSRLNLGGMRSWMMRLRMRALGIPSLEEMFEQARQSGVRLVACQMSIRDGGEEGRADRGGRTGGHSHLPRGLGHCPGYLVSLRWSIFLNAPGCPGGSRFCFG